MQSMWQPGCASPSRGTQHSPSTADHSSVLLHSKSAQNYKVTFFFLFFFPLSNGFISPAAME